MMNTIKQQAVFGLWVLLLIGSAAQATQSNPYLQQVQEFYRSRVNKTHQKVDELLEQEATRIRETAKQLIQKANTNLTNSDFTREYKKFERDAESLLGLLSQAQELDQYDVETYQQLLDQQNALRRQLYTFGAELWPLQHAVGQLQRQIPQPNKDMFLFNRVWKMSLSKPGYDVTIREITCDIKLRTQYIKLANGTTTSLKCLDTTSLQELASFAKNNGGLANLYHKREREEKSIQQTFKRINASESGYKTFLNQIGDKTSEMTQKVLKKLRQISFESKKLKQEVVKDKQLEKSFVSDAHVWISSHPLNPEEIARDYLTKEANWQGTVQAEYQTFVEKCKQITVAQQEHIRGCKKRIFQTNCSLQKVDDDMKIYRKKLLQKDTKKLLAPLMEKMEVDAKTFAWMLAFRKHVKPLTAQLMKRLRRAPSYSSKLHCIQITKTIAQRHLDNMAREWIVSGNRNNSSIKNLAQRFWKGIQRYEQKLARRFSEQNREEDDDELL